MLLYFQMQCFDKVRMNLFSVLKSIGRVRLSKSTSTAIEFRWYSYPASTMSELTGELKLMLQW